MNTNGVVRLVKGKNIGTGFFISDSLILTCHHVVNNSGLHIGDNVDFFQQGKRDMQCAVVERTYPSCDVAVLRSKEKSDSFYMMNEIRFSNHQSLQTFGFPNRSKEGKVAYPEFMSSVNSCKIQLGNANSITYGFSGAPLFDADESLVGMIKGISKPDESGRGTNDATAVPVSAILLAMNESTRSFEINLVREEIDDYLNAFQSDNDIESILPLIPLNGIEDTVSEKVNEKRASNPFRKFGPSRIQQSYEIEDDCDNSKKVITNIWEAIEKRGRRVVLLGEPGSGKTVSMVRLTLDYAKVSLKDEDALIPIYIPLGSFKEDCSLEEYIFEKCTYEKIVTGYKQNIDKFIFMFDALNELETTKKNMVLEYIKKLKHFVVSCRLLDYRADLSTISNLSRITILDFDPGQIKSFIDGYFQGQNGSRKQHLLQVMGWSIELQTFWDKARSNDKANLFWADPKSVDLAEVDSLSVSLAEREAWDRAYQIGLLSICKCPLLLTMVCIVFCRNGGIPKTNGGLFKTFVDESLDIALERAVENADINIKEKESTKDKVINLLSLLASIIISNNEGTGIATTKGRSFLSGSFSDMEIDLYEKIAVNSNLLVKNKAEERFFHQLVQEYFGSRYIQDAFAVGRSSRDFFDITNWWVPNGWEEAAVMLVGILYSEGEEKGLNLVNDYLLWLSDAQPALTVRCIERSGISELNLFRTDEKTKRAIQEKLVNRLKGTTDSLSSKIVIGQALGRFGDIRNGVGITTGKRNIPQIKWITGAGNIMISKYPVTVAQFYCFVNSSDGYSCPDYWTFSDACKIWYEENKNHRIQLWTREYLEFHSNEPVTNVSWWEAKAFCGWLSRQLDLNVMLPSEKEWISLYETAGNGHPKTESLCSVGLLVESDECLSDLGLVWEWCNDAFYGIIDDNITCLLKGGSWQYDSEYQKSSDRMFTYPNFKRNDVGFRIIASSKGSMEFT